MAASLLSKASPIIWPKRPIFSHGQFRSNLSFPPQQLQPPHLAIRAHQKRTLQFAVKDSGKQGPLCTQRFKVQASSFDGPDSGEQEKSKLPQRDTKENEQGGKVEAISNNGRYIVYITTVIVVFTSLFCFFIALVLLFQSRSTFVMLPLNQRMPKLRIRYTPPLRAMPKGTVGYTTLESNFGFPIGAPQQFFPSYHLSTPEIPNETIVARLLLTLSNLKNKIVAIMEGIDYGVKLFYDFKDPIKNLVILILAFIFVMTIVNCICVIVVELKMNEIENLLKKRQGKSKQI